MVRIGAWIPCYWSNGCRLHPLHLQIWLLLVLKKQDGAGQHTKVYGINVNMNFKSSPHTFETQFIDQPRASLKGGVQQLTYEAAHLNFERWIGLHCLSRCRMGIFHVGAPHSTGHHFLNYSLEVLNAIPSIVWCKIYWCFARVWPLQPLKDLSIDQTTDRLLMGLFITIVNNYGFSLSVYAGFNFAVKGQSQRCRALCDLMLVRHSWSLCLWARLVTTDRWMVGWLSSTQDLSFTASDI